MTGCRQIRMLIVDDEAGFAEVLCKRLGRRGVCATWVGSGEEGVRLLRSEEFDAALLDLKLQGMDGIEILRVFKLMAPEMPILMLTGHGSREAMEACLRLGAEEYLSKPVEFEVLLDRVLRLVGANQRSES